MPLPLAVNRILSPMEREAVELVFKDPGDPEEKSAINPESIKLTIVEALEPEFRPQQNQIGVPWAALKREVASTYDGDGLIRISQSAFPHTDLNESSTRADMDTDEFKPGNMHYLSTLIHECTHYWQDLYWRHGPPVYHVKAPQFTDFQFAYEQLSKRDVPDLSSEQHASAVQVYFLIAWQLQNRFGTPDVNLTSQSEDAAQNVGPVDRFLTMDLPYYRSDETGSRIFDNKKALDLRDNYFGWLIVELRYGWRVVCEGKEPLSTKECEGWRLPEPEVPPGAIALAGGGWIDPKKLPGGGP